MFGWHKEDLDLSSINFLHTGSKKFWYSIDLDSNEEFGRLLPFSNFSIEEFTSRCFPDQSKQCSDFLRHKNTIINPGVLLKAGIKLHK